MQWMRMTVVWVGVCCVVFALGCAGSRADMTQLRADNARLADEVAEVRAQRDACAADLEMFKTMATEVAGSLDALQTKASTSTEGLGDCENQVRRTRTALLEAQGEVRRLARQLDIKKVEVAAARRAGRTAQQRITDLERQLAGEPATAAPAGNEADTDSYRPLPQSFP